MRQVKSLNLTVMGGLCSRLRAVLAASDWCERHDVSDLIINWPTHEPNLDEFGGFTVRLRELWEVPVWWYEVDSWFKKWPKSLDQAAQKYDDHLYIRTCHPEDFAPRCTADLMRQLGKMEFRHESKVYPDCIGVNIRHALREKMDVARPDWFAGRLHELWPYQTPGYLDDVKLVTDGDAAETQFMDALDGTTVYVNKREYKYDANGIRAQAAELYELSSTKWFIGSDMSSYSQMVRWMRGDTELDMAKCNNAACRSEDRLNPASAELLREVFG